MPQKQKTAAQRKAQVAKATAASMAKRAGVRKQKARAARDDAVRAAVPQRGQGEQEGEPVAATAASAPSAPPPEAASSDARQMSARPLAVDWAPAYIASLSRSARKGAAAIAAGTALSTIRDRRKADPVFAAAELAAMEVAVDLIEDEITRRAIEGVEEPVYGSGGAGVGTVRVGSILRFSDTLILRLAERAETGTWRQRQQIEHGAPGAFRTHADLQAAIAKRQEALAEVRAAMAADSAQSAASARGPESGHVLTAVGTPEGP